MNLIAVLVALVVGLIVGAFIATQVKVSLKVSSSFDEPPAGPRSSIRSMSLIEGAKQALQAMLSERSPDYAGLLAEDGSLVANVVWLERKLMAILPTVWNNNELAPAMAEAARRVPPESGELKWQRRGTGVWLELPQDGEQALELLRWVFRNVFKLDEQVLVRLQTAGEAEDGEDED